MADIRSNMRPVPLQNTLFEQTDNVGDSTLQEQPIQTTKNGSMMPFFIPKGLGSAIKQVSQGGNGRTPNLSMLNGSSPHIWANNGLEGLPESMHDPTGDELHTNFLENKNMLLDLIKKKKLTSKRQTGEGFHMQKQPSFSNAQFALAHIYRSSSRSLLHQAHARSGQQNNIGASVSPSKASKGLTPTKNAGNVSSVQQENPVILKKTSSLASLGLENNIPPSAGKKGDYTGHHTPQPGLSAEEVHMFESECEKFSRKVDDLLINGVEKGLEFSDLIKINQSLLSSMIDKLSSGIMSSVIKRINLTGEKLAEFAKKQKANIANILQDMDNINKDKANLNLTVNKLKNKVLELAEEKQNYEERVKDLETKMDLARTKKTLGFNFRGLLEENEDLKDGLRDQNRTIEELKSKEVKLIKLVYYIKKEGVDIDEIYGKYAEEIQREDDESQFMTEQSDALSNIDADAQKQAAKNKNQHASKGQEIKVIGNEKGLDDDDLDPDVDFDLNQEINENLQNFGKEKATVVVPKVKSKVMLT